MNLPNPFKLLWLQFRSEWRLYVRDRGAMFWTFAFPILMARRPNPLVPLDLFRSRSFTTINLATFFLYGALYVTFSYQGIVFQGVLGYTALAAGAVGLPIGLCLTLLSARMGALVGRLGCDGGGKGNPRCAEPPGCGRRHRASSRARAEREAARDRMERNGTETPAVR